MHFDAFDEVKKITRGLVSVPSIVGREGQETACAEKVYEYYSALEYFQKRPQQLYLLKTEEDNVQRHSTIAYVKGSKNAGGHKTVILMGHIDTVDVADYIPDASAAFDSEKAVRQLGGLDDLPPAVRRDLESGEYMFGRGCLDMKSGVACQMYIVI